MFASRSLAIHLGRGVIGIGALVVATYFASTHPWSALVLVPLALVALRGCPTCWTIGLVQTVVASLRGKQSAGCRDGSCAFDRKR